MILPRIAHHRRGAAGIIRDRRGTAGIEFALIAPVIVLLLIGLRDGVADNLRAMDVDAAAHAGAAAALRHGFDVARMTAAMRAAGGKALTGTITLIDCDDKRPRRRADPACRTLPVGRYANVVATDATPTNDAVAISSVALVRLS